MAAPRLFALLSLALLASSARITEDKLSPKALQVYKHVIQDLNGREQDTPTPSNLILTSAQFKGQLAAYGNTDEFSKQIFYDKLVNAKHEVLMTTMIFTKSQDAPSPRAVEAALYELNRRAGERKQRVRFYLAYDEFGTAFFQKTTIPLHRLFKTRTVVKDPRKKMNLPMPSELKWIDFQVKSYHRHLLGALHSKMILIDGRTSILGSKNMDGDDCMEYMFVMEGALTGSLRADFKRIWKDPIDDCPTLSQNYHSKDVPVLVVSHTEGYHLTSRNIHSPQNQAWLKAMDVAKEHVYIQTPNFCERAIAEKVLETLKRNVKVTIVTGFRQQDTNEAMFRTSMGSNAGTMKDMYKAIKNPGYNPTNLQWCWFIGMRAGPDPKPTQNEWSHVKFMAVDDEFAIIGSGNQDPQTWYHSREVNVLVDDPTVTKQMVGELLRSQQSLKYCYNGFKGEKREK